MVPTLRQAGQAPPKGAKGGATNVFSLPAKIKPWRPIRCYSLGWASPQNPYLSTFEVPTLSQKARKDGAPTCVNMLAEGWATRHPASPLQVTRLLLGWAHYILSQRTQEVSFAMIFENW